MSEIDNNRYHKDLFVPYPNRNETKYEVCKRRNRYLMEFFAKVKMDIELIGDPQKPAIIINGNYCLSAYVHNFMLHFTDKPFRGDIVESYKLNAGYPISHTHFMNLYTASEQRKVYKIRYGDSDLYLAGYNFTDKSTSKGKYPVFARKKFKYYFSLEKVNEIISDFTDYPLECV